MSSANQIPLVTHAQNREDLYLWGLLGDRAAGTYVDVGCNHEDLHSVTRLFYEHGWSGINIDANPLFAAQFECRVRDKFVLAGIGAEPGSMSFRVYPQHDGLSTFDETIKALHLASGYPFEDVTVPVRTLDSVLIENDVTTIDFLKIDVEGFEPQVLEGLDLNRFRPTVIVVEASRAEACEAILLPARYHHEFFDGLNSYYVDDVASGVTIHNYAGRVLHQGYLTAREQRLAADLDATRAAAEAQGVQVPIEFDPPRVPQSTAKRLFDRAVDRFDQAKQALTRRT